MNATAVIDVIQRIEAALATLEEPRVQTLGDTIYPPSTVVGMPSLRRESYCDEFTSARIPVYLIVPFNDRARDRLLHLVGPVAAAIESVEDVVVSEQTTTTPFNANGTDVPAYEFTAEVAL